MWCVGRCRRRGRQRWRDGGTRKVVWSVAGAYWGIRRGPGWGGARRRKEWRGRSERGSQEKSGGQEVWEGSTARASRRRLRGGECWRPGGRRARARLITRLAAPRGLGEGEGVVRRPARQGAARGGVLARQYIQKRVCSAKDGEVESGEEGGIGTRHRGGPPREAARVCAVCCVCMCVCCM